MEHDLTDFPRIFSSFHLTEGPNRFLQVQTRTDRTIGKFKVMIEAMYNSDLKSC